MTPCAGFAYHRLQGAFRARSPVPRDLSPPLPATATAVQPLGCVLVVEDDPWVAESTVALVESFGWTVRHAPDAESALELLDADETVDVVLTDIAMPGEFDGADLAVHLRRTRPALRVVVMTGRVDKVHRVAGDGFVLLPKPCAPSELAAALGAQA